MATEFKLPELGENITSGDVVSILVSEGDKVEANQSIMEVETGKAVVEIPAPHAGIVKKIHVKNGQSVPVGELIVTIEADGADAGTESKGAEKAEAKQAEKAEPKEEKKPAKAAEKAPKREAPAVAEEDEEEAEPAPGRPARQPARPAARVDESDGNGVAAPAGPATRRLARELGVDIRRVKGSGPDGRITREDIVAAVRQSTARGPAKPRKPGADVEGVASQDDFGPVHRQPLTRIRKAIAENMGRSVSIPHVTNFDDADITELERIRKGSMANSVGSEVKLTMMPFVIKAVAQSLKLHPVINASLDLEAGEIIYKDYVNVGVAVDSERGLVVPVMRDVDQMSIPAIAEQLNDMAARVRAAKFSQEDIQGGTFTISNLGAIGGAYSTPIINAPEVAILLVGRSRLLPVYVGDKLEPRLMMPLSLSYDHRLIDGANAARFLNEVKSFLETPGRLLLAT